MAPSIAPMSPQHTWYATYLSDTREALAGVATYTPQGWTFTPEGGTCILNVTLHDLCLCGQVALADAQHQRDQRARAWEHHMLFTGCQVMAEPWNEGVPVLRRSCE